MTRLRRSTRRRDIKPVGVSKRLGDAPPTTYVHTDRRPEPHHTYVLDGVVHRWDGRCHPDCDNLR